MNCRIKHSLQNRIKYFLRIFILQLFINEIPIVFVKGIWFCPTCQPTTNIPSEQSEVSYCSKNEFTKCHENVMKIKNLEDELNRTGRAFAELNSKMKGLEQERNDLNKKLSNAANTNKALEKNLKEFSQALTVSECENEKLNNEKNELQVEDDRNKYKIVEIKASNAKALAQVNSYVKELEKERTDLNKKVSNAAITQETLKKNLKVYYEDEIQKLKKEQKSELQLEAERNKMKIEKIIESNVKALAEANSKSKDLEQERDSLNKKLSNTLTENSQALRDAKSEIKKLKKELSEQKIEAEELKESVAKDRKFKENLAVEIWRATGEELVPLLKLDLEELLSKSNANSKDLVNLKTELSEEVTNLKSKLNLQIFKRENYEAKHEEIMNFLEIPVENRYIENILPAIRSLKTYEQGEIDQYSNAEKVLDSHLNGN